MYLEVHTIMNVLGANAILKPALLIFFFFTSHKRGSPSRTSFMGCETIQFCLFLACNTP